MQQQPRGPALLRHEPPAVGAVERVASPNVGLTGLTDPPNTTKRGAYQPGLDRVAE